MANFSGSQAGLPIGVPSDTEAPRNVDPTADILPSAGDSSGLSPQMRQHLDEQVRSGGAGNLVADLRARIAEIDERSTSPDDPDHTRLPAERALYVAQITYLEDQAGVSAADSRGESRNDTVAGAGAGSGDDASGVASGGGGGAYRSAGGRRRVRVYDR